jgi:hypothetical protein
VRIAKIRDDRRQSMSLPCIVDRMFLSMLMKTIVARMKRTEIVLTERETMFEWERQQKTCVLLK